jgi:hypothetical protein
MIDTILACAFWMVIVAVLLHLIKDCINHK